MKLEPTEAQRKAMAIAAALGASQGWSDRVDDWLPIVDEMFVAANSIPEGPPVDTIARRPDGKYLATRILTVSDGTPAWNYKNLTWPEVEWEYLRQNDADSWPVIYDPREYEGTEYDPETGLHWFKPGEEPLVPRPDPTAQQEPDRFPGIENPTTADHVGADNADEQLKLIFALQCIRVERGLSVAHVGEALGLEDSEVERFESGSTNPTMSMIRRYARAVEAVFTVDVRKWEDSSAQQEPGESLARGLDDLAAGRVSRRDDYLEPQPEPATTHPVSPESTNCVPKPRTPRVVDRLGVDEQGSLWRNRADTEFWFQDECWNFRTKDGCTSWYTAGYEPKMRIFTEILEPRVLPSLDCEEARDGTEWKFRLNGEPRSLVYRNNGWRYGEVGDRIGGRCGVSDGHAFIREFAPYIEVVGDPS